MLGQGDLAAAVALMHAADLGHRHMALVDDAQEIVREIVDERVRGLSGLAPVQMAGVVLDTAAKAHGLQHLKIVVHAHLQPLDLKQLALLFKLLQTLAQLLLDGLDSVLHLRARRYVMGGRPNGKSLIGLQNLACYVVYLGNLLYLIAPELHAHRIVRVRREHIEVIPAHAERAAFQLVVVAVVLDVDKVVDHLVAIHFLLLVHEHGHARVIHGAANTVYAADRRHHDHVAPGKERAGGGMAQLLHLLVDGGVLLDERVRRGHVRFRLVIIVVADEIHHGVVGEELLQLACKLSGKRLVRRHDKRGALHRLDGFRHGERFARTRDAQKRLIPQPLLNALCQLLDGLRLIARRLIRADRSKRRVRKAHFGQLALHCHALDVLQMAAHMQSRPSQALPSNQCSKSITAYGKEQVYVFASHIWQRKRPLQHAAPGKTR